MENDNIEKCEDPRVKEGEDLKVKAMNKNADNQIVTDESHYKQEEKTIYPEGTVINDKENKQNIWRCQNCGYDSASKEEFEHHMTTNHKTSKLTFKPQEKLGTHLENNEAEQIISELVFACQDCFFNSKTEKELHEHTKEKHTLACKSCLYVCKNKKDLNEHTMLKHNFECNKCNFSSKNQKDLKEHVVEKHTFNCKECSYVNSSTSKVDQHE